MVSSYLDGTWQKFSFIFINLQIKLFNKTLGQKLCINVKMVSSYLDGTWQKFSLILINLQIKLFIKTLGQKIMYKRKNGL